MNRPRSRPPRSRPAAFTIVEVMMGVIIMAFSITTSITTMQRGFLALDSARNVSVASQIMQSELEKMRLKDWFVVNAYAPGPTGLTIDALFTANAVIGSRFTLTRSTATPVVDGVTMTDLKSITLTVAWTNVDGRAMSRSYTTYYGRYGLYDYYYNTA